MVGRRLLRGLESTSDRRLIVSELGVITPSWMYLRIVGDILCIPMGAASRGALLLCVGQESAWARLRLRTVAVVPEACPWGACISHVYQGCLQGHSHLIAMRVALQVAQRKEAHLFPLRSWMWATGLLTRHT